MVSLSNTPTYPILKQERKRIVPEDNEIGRKVPGFIFLGM